MSDAPRVCVSIITPVYNPGRYLGDCLKSLSAQEGDDIEFILVDDGSTDGSCAALNGFAAGEKRAKVYHIENCGVSAARNYALDRASGRWICFLDSDDVLSSRFIARVRPYLTDTRDIVYYSWGRFSRDDGSDIVEDLPAGEHECTPDELRLICQTSLCPSQALSKTALRFRGGVGVCGFLMRSDMPNGMSLRFERGVKLSEDSAFRLQYMSHCQNGICLSDVLYFYRTNANSATLSYSEHVREDLMRTLALMRSVVKNYYNDDSDMVQRYYGFTINVSRNFFAKYLFHAKCPLSEAEKIKVYDEYRGEPPLAEGIAKCDKNLLQEPYSSLLDAFRVEKAETSLRMAASALKPKRSLRSFVDKLGVLPMLRRLLKRFK